MKANQIFEILKTGNGELFLRIPTGHAITAKDLLDAMVSCKAYLLENGVEETLINRYLTNAAADRQPVQ